MHECVGGRDQVPHALGEAEHADPGVLAEALLETLPDLLVAPGHADHGRDPRVEGAAHGAVQVPDPPASAGHQDHPPDLGQPERAPGLERGPGLEVLRGYERTHLM